MELRPELKLMKVRILSAEGDNLATRELQPIIYVTGAKGFYTSFRMYYNAILHQFNVQATEVGSEPVPIAKTGQGDTQSEDMPSY